ncbi:transketolase [Lichenicola cladoniae]|uniref:Transketolase n=2 Tax=Lichenicola cladoniae TaxID=1484109 RepID=A0A6M8HTZ3_9PROT|nr:transketolase [Acetobacteraceae bacterium]QKE91838.1 transketolase [Lichenicola cladoniae]
MRSGQFDFLRAPDGSAAGPSISMDQLCINTMRTLSMDAVQKANSGHPGTPMSLSPAAYVLWNEILRYNPVDPNWPNRDRFVLSVGHASMLLYSLIFLAGVKSVNEGEDRNAPSLTLEDLKQFRQLSSKTPGHPEYRFTSGVETTTGPLGQGCGNSVGMAMAQRWLATRYNKPGFPIFDYHVWTFSGDGDQMEGISSEAASIAGHLQLSNLTWLYDSNQISIEGSTELAFTENTHKRFEGYGWNVVEVHDAQDIDLLKRAYEMARAQDGAPNGKPTLIVVHSKIAYGAPKKQGTAAAHGEPLGDEEIAGTKKFYGWPEDKKFFVPDGVMEHFQAGIGERGKGLNAGWLSMIANYKAEYPELAAELEQMNQHELPAGWDQEMPVFETNAKGVASRESSAKILNAIAPHVPWLIGGSADLSPSTKTNLTFQGAGSFQPDNYGGRNLHFGVREHAMGSISNGIALSGIRPYCSGFLIFSDYMKAPIRLSAIMELPVVYIFTHDSIGVGEDGPTHQPIEQLAQLRATPGIMTIRPGDANEVAEAWRVILPLKEKPAALILSRQALPTLDRTKYAPASGLAKGAYVVGDCEGTPDVILMGTGSELALVVGVYETLIAEGIKARVVSMPSFDLFEEQSDEYKESVLPLAVKGRVAVEQAAAFGWDRYTGLTGAIIAMHTFGASAPLSDLLTKFGFTPEKVLEAARNQAKGGKAIGGKI